MHLGEVALQLASDLVTILAQAEGEGDAVPGLGAATAIVKFIGSLRDAGLFGVSILVIVGLLTRRIVPGWVYQDALKAAEREKLRADALELLVARLTTNQRQANEVTANLLMMGQPQARGFPPPPTLSNNPPALFSPERSG